MAQAGEDPALHHLHADFDLRLVPRLVGSGGNDRGAVVRRHVGIGPVHRRLVEAGLGDAGLQIVADDLPRHTAEERQDVHMHGDPVRQRLAPGRLRVDQAGGAQHRDEDLRPARLAGRPVEHLHGVTGEVDEQLLPRDVHLAQRRLQPPDPLPIEIAEPGIAEAVRSTGAVFFPQQRQRHVRATQLAMDRGPVRHRPLVHRHIRHRWEQQLLETIVVQIIRQRPAQSRPPGPAQIAVHRAGAQPKAVPDGTLRRTLARTAGAVPRVSSASTISRPAFRSPAARQKIEPTRG